MGGSEATRTQNVAQINQESRAVARQQRNVAEIKLRWNVHCVGHIAAAARLCRWIDRYRYLHLNFRRGSKNACISKSNA